MNSDHSGGDRDRDQIIRDLEYWHALADARGAALRAWWAHEKLLTRWPCFYCGRTGPNKPLKTVTVIREDGEQSIQGCHACNTDELVAMTDAALAAAPREAQ